MENDLPVAARGIVSLLALAGAVYSTYATILAFVGGSLWPFGWEIGGSVGLGLVWIFLVDPIVMTVFYWAAMLIAMPVAAIFGGRS